LVVDKALDISRVDRQSSKPKTHKKNHIKVQNYKDLAT
jgi:hypothetical protein